MVGGHTGRVGSVAIDVVVERIYITDLQQNTKCNCDSHSQYRVQYPQAPCHPYSPFSPSRHAMCNPKVHQCGEAHWNRPDEQAICRILNHDDLEKEIMRYQQCFAPCRYRQPRPRSMAATDMLCRISLYSLNLTHISGHIVYRSTEMPKADANRTVFNMKNAMDKSSSQRARHGMA